MLYNVVWQNIKTIRHENEKYKKKIASENYGMLKSFVQLHESSTCRFNVQETVLLSSNHITLIAAVNKSQ